MLYLYLYADDARTTTIAKLNLKQGYDDRTNPMDRHVGALAENVGLEPAPIPAQLFGAAGIEHMKKYGTKEIHMGKIAWKNHKHSVNNP